MSSQLLTTNRSTWIQVPSDEVLLHDQDLGPHVPPAERPPPERLPASAHAHQAPPQGSAPGSAQAPQASQALAAHAPQPPQMPRGVGGLLSWEDAYYGRLDLTKHYKLKVCQVWKQRVHYCYLWALWATTWEWASDFMQMSRNLPTIWESFQAMWDLES